MKGLYGLSGWLATGAVVMLAALPANATATQVTGVRVNPRAGGVELVLETRNGDRPQIFTVNRGNVLVADVINTQLRLPQGNGFLQNNPAPGINSVMVSQLDTNSIRVTVTGEAAPPTSQINQASQAIVFNLGAGTAAPQQPGRPAATRPSTTQAQAQVPTPQIPAPPNPDVMVPNPQIRIDGSNVPAPTPGIPPLLPRAEAPPVGDIAIATTDASPATINLNTREVVPRLVLRDAPVRDVLSLLARAAGLNVAYIEGGTAAAQTGNQQTGAQPTQGAGAAAAAAQTRISLDIENEPVQNVFNHVLRISGLEANLNGRTIFVGPRLPNSARQTVMRTLRLNQITVGSALNFLVGMGAETAVSRVRQVATVTAIPFTNATGGAGQEASGVNQVQTTQEERIEVQRVDFTDSTPILRGLQVIGDERTNSVTLVGNPRAVEIAVAQLVHLDVRRRQVAINVRVIDVNLGNIDRLGTSFSFGINDTNIVSDGGVGIINFGNTTPFGAGITPQQVSGGVGTFTPTNPANIANNFLLQLRAAITSGNAKILTDPTLVVQEGQNAEVRLTQEVVTNFEIETEGTGTDRTQTITVERTPAGLILQVRVERVDDNGFVSLSVAPSISAPSGTFSADIRDASFDITLLAERRLSSGLVRIRDGQTLVLSGIIQDQDRTTVTKVPILGDIPLLGALFRRTERTNTRQEVIVLLTPQIINDSDVSTWGYRYTPTRETQQFIQQRGGRQIPQ